MRIESYNEWVNALKKSTKLILVEGINDQKALKRLGIKRSYPITKTPFYSVVEEIAKRTNEVIILTDLDKEGKKYYSKLKNELQKRGVKIDRVFREFLFKKTAITQIEGLPCNGLVLNPNFY